MKKESRLPRSCVRLSSVALALLLALQITFVASAAPSPSAWAAEAGLDAVPGQLLVGFEPGTTESSRDTVVARQGAQTVRSLSGLNARLVQLPAGRSRLASMQVLTEQAGVRYAEPNYYRHLRAVPNDPDFATLWGSQNTGQLVNEVAGTAGADIKAVSAWDTTTGSRNVVVGVIDTGIDYDHPDLAANVWNAPAGWTLGGCAAGSHGFRSVGGMTSCDPMDDNNHGTHVAGTIGATGNNGIGVAGVNWQVSIMGLEGISSEAGATVGDLVATLAFAAQARQAGVNLRVLNGSYGGPNFSEAERDAMKLINDAGILFVNSSGNEGQNNDAIKDYPSGYDYPNIISVAATDNQDNLTAFSNFGATTVHMAAPGARIYSTTCNPVNGVCTHGYQYMDGTSMSSPQVAGAAALILSAPGLGNLTVEQLKQRLIDCGDVLPSLNGKTISGRRLNVAKSIAGCQGPGFNVNVSTTGNGKVAPGSGTYGNPAAFTATPEANTIFTGWTIDGVFVGFNPQLSLALTKNRTVVANFAPRPAHPDVTANNPAFEAVAQLGARGIIKGYEDGTFGPDDKTLRAQMAALVARTMNYSDDPANPFTDKCDPANPANCIDNELWKRVAELASRTIARGYTNPATCSPAAAPCYAPRDNVLHAQVISFITRAMVAQGYWKQQTTDPNLYGGVLNGSGHEQDATTYWHYTRGKGGVPDYPENGPFAAWNTASTRAWFSRTLWVAYSSYFSTNRIP